MKNHSSSPLSLALARDHQRMLREDAERGRILANRQNTSPETQSLAASVRQRIGYALIRSGRRIEGAGIHSGEVINERQAVSGT